MKVEENKHKSENVVRSQVGNIVRVTDDRLSTLEQNYGKMFTEVATAKSSTSKTCMQVDAFTAEIEKIKRDYSGLRSDELVPFSSNSSYPLDYIKQVEEKMLKVESTLNILSVHHSELELQLQSFLASTHNGAFLWHIPETKRRICDAKLGVELPATIPHRKKWLQDVHQSLS